MVRLREYQQQETAVILRAGGSTGGGDIKIQELLWELEPWQGGSTRVGSTEEAAAARLWAGGEAPWLLFSSCLLIFHQYLPLAKISSLVGM